MAVRTGGVAGLAVAVLALAHPALAGPPYVTDDPEPTDLGRWEIYSFLSGSKVQGAEEGEAGLDLNYGAAEDLQLTMVLPVAFERSDRTRTGPSDLELAAKYRFLRQDRGGALDMAFFPQVTLPTGGKRFGERRPTLFLPLWAQKDLGPWSMFGGGGYEIRSRERDIWTMGLALTRPASERLSLGGEVYRETAEERGGKAFTGVNLGGSYRLSEHWSLLGSGGPGVQNQERGRFRFYLGLKADY